MRRRWGAKIGDRWGLGLRRRLASALRSNRLPRARRWRFTIPLACQSLVRQSEADARAGDLNGALEAARSAQNVEPGAASPRLQQALVLELQGGLAAAEGAVRAATERESTNWRNWLVLSRIAAERGRAEVSVRAYEEARAMNPHASILRR